MEKDKSISGRVIERLENAKRVHEVARGGLVASIAGVLVSGLYPNEFAALAIPSEIVFLLTASAYSVTEKKASRDTDQNK
jgi:hypothetical protein